MLKFSDVLARFVIIPLLFLSIIAAAFLFLRDDDENRAAFSPTRSRYTVVIDPGHGGEDGGAVSAGGTVESEINLDICLKLEQIMAFYGVNTVMTRSTEELQYPPETNSARDKKVFDQKRRVDIINSTENPILISIHQNKFDDGKPFGAQVLYGVEGHGKEFGELMQNTLVTALDKSNYRVASQIPKDIYIMKNAHCPALLIECGFLSNAKDEANLLTESYRLKIAVSIASGYLMANDTIFKNPDGGNYESKNSFLLY